MNMGWGERGIHPSIYDYTVMWWDIQHPHKMDISLLALKEVTCAKLTNPLCPHIEVPTSYWKIIHPVL